MNIVPPVDRETQSTLLRVRNLCRAKTKSPNQRDLGCGSQQTGLHVAGNDKSAALTTGRKAP